jgi:hypothetical protein
MSNLWFNIRFGKRHFQFSRDWQISFSKNPYWDTLLKSDYDVVSWFQVYCAFGKHF